MRIAILNDYQGVALSLARRSVRPRLLDDQYVWDGIVSRHIQC
jgi:hypothetical protein